MLLQWFTDKYRGRCSLPATGLSLVTPRKELVKGLKEPDSLRGLCGIQFQTVHSRVICAHTPPEPREKPRDRCGCFWQEAYAHFWVPTRNVTKDRKTFDNDLQRRNSSLIVSRGCISSLILAGCPERLKSLGVSEGARASMPRQGKIQEPRDRKSQ